VFQLSFVIRRVRIEVALDFLFCTVLPSGHILSLAHDIENKRKRRKKDRQTEVHHRCFDKSDSISVFFVGKNKNETQKIDRCRNKQYL